MENEDCINWTFYNFLITLGSKGNSKPFISLDVIVNPIVTSNTSTHIVTLKYSFPLKETKA